MIESKRESASKHVRKSKSERERVRAREKEEI